MLIIGSIIGAGFSSGQEILTFFTGSGKFSYLIIILSTIFLYISLKELIKFGRITKSKTIKEINKTLFKNITFFNVFIYLSLFVFIIAMIAGLNSIGGLIFKNINFPILTIVSLFFALFICELGYNAIKKVNNFLMPVVILLIIFVTLFNIFVNFKNFQTINITFINFFEYLLLGFCYISYNIVFSSSLIVENSINFCNKKTKINALVISVILGGLILLINIALLKTTNYNNALPMLSLAFNINNVVGYLFSFILWFSVLTSLISCLYMLINNFKINKIISSSIILTLGYMLSLFGFNNIINFIYPIQGIIGLIFLFKIFAYNKKQGFKSKNTLQKL